MKKLGIFIPSYKSTQTLEQVLLRIPKKIRERADEIYVVDDASPTDSYENALAVKQKLGWKNLSVSKNKVNQGYGGNQKVGYKYAIEKGFDIVVMLHGDGQYAPEKISELISPIDSDSAEMVTGSRFLKNKWGDGMPRWRFFSNRFLNFLQQVSWGYWLSDHNCGLRAYSVSALKKIPFELLTQDYYFDTEIITQFRLAGFKIGEIAIPTHYDADSHNPTLWKTFKFFLYSLKTLLDYRLATVGITPEKFRIKRVESK